jgi:hypothetical protein
LVEFVGIQIVWNHRYSMGVLPMGLCKLLCWEMLE